MTGELLRTVKLKKPPPPPSSSSTAVVGVGKPPAVAAAATPTPTQFALKTPTILDSPCSLIQTSPCTSLLRVLNTADSTNNSSAAVRRVKRLKRIGGYSFDDVSRRNQLAKKERERTYN